MSENQNQLQGPSELGSALVTGAAGALGPGLVRELVAAGYAVRAVDRYSPPPGAFPQGVDSWKGDICDREFMSRAVQGMRVVFHLAARLHLTNPGPELRSEYWRVNVEGTRILTEECLAGGVQRLVFFSTINVYGATPGSCADEDTPPQPDSLYAETKLAAEEAVLGVKGSPIGIVLRMAAIYGPRMKGNYPRLVNALSQGWFVPVGDGHNRRTLIYEDDVVRAALLAAMHPKAPGRVYNVSDGGIHMLSEVIASICAALGRRVPRFFLPTRPTRWVTNAADGLAKFAGRSLNLTTVIDKFVEDVAVRSERIRRELAFEPLYGLEEGWRRTVDALRAEKNSTGIAIY